MSISELAGTDANVDDEGSKVQLILDLMAHKKPNMKSLEINMVPHSSESIWTQSESHDKAVRAACPKYTFATNDAAIVVEAEEKHSRSANTEFALLDLLKEPHDYSTTLEKDCDFVFVRVPPAPSKLYSNIVENVRGLMGAEGRFLLIEHEANRSGSASSDDLVHIPREELGKTKSSATFMRDTD